ncbi:MAG: hypothetical protein ABIY48_09880 [Acidimicrobiales bacterium]
MRLLRRNRDPQVVVDLREPARGSSPAPAWGSPLPCPECASRGYLDHIDPFNEIMYLHCTQCGVKYERTRAELKRVVA